MLEQTELRFEVKAGPTGSLFGSVTPTDLADEIWRVAKVRVDRRKIGLDDPIKKIGRYEVPIELFTDVTVDVRTLVVPEGGELPPGGAGGDGRGNGRGGRGSRRGSGRGGRAEARRGADRRGTRRDRAGASNDFSTGPVEGLGISAGKGRNERSFHPPHFVRLCMGTCVPFCLQNGRAARVDECVVQALFGRVRRWSICPRCINLPRLRRPPRSHRRTSMPRSRSSAR